MTEEIVLEQEIHKPLPVGEYLAEIAAIEDQDGQWGPQLRFTFAIADGDYSNRFIYGWATKKFSTKSKLYAWTKAALNVEIPTDKQFRSSELIGQRVRLVLVQREGNEGEVYNKIDDLKPAANEKRFGGIFSK